MPKTCPTKRAGDLGYAPRYFGFFRLFELFFRFGGESTLPPQAPNASRWALEQLLAIIGIATRK